MEDTESLKECIQAYMIIKGSGLDIYQFDKKNRIKNMMNVDDEINFVLKSLNHECLCENVMILAEREEDKWNMNSIGHKDQGLIIIMPYPEVIE